MERKTKKELNSILKKSMVIISVAAVVMFLAGEFLGPVFAKLYVGSDHELLALTTKAFRIFSICFIFCGFSIYFSSFFTALNNGVISAIISLAKNLVFELSFVFLIPLMMGGDGIWWSIPVADMCSFVMSFIFLFACNKRYGYILPKQPKVQINE